MPLGVGQLGAFQLGGGEVIVLVGNGPPTFLRFLGVNTAARLLARPTTPTLHRVVTVTRLTGRATTPTLRRRVTDAGIVPRVTTSPIVVVRTNTTIAGG